MRPIDADKFEVVGGYVPEGYDVDSYLAGNNEILEMIDNAPTIDVVSVGVLEQYKWERDVAISQLEELGIGFGQKKPDMVEVVRCKNCIHWGTGYVAETEHIKECEYAHYMVGENGYCVYGEVENEHEDQTK